MIKARAARDEHGLDFEIVEGVGYPVEQNPVVSGDSLTDVLPSGGDLGIATTELSRWQDCLYSRMVEESLTGQGHVRKETLGAASREIEYGFRILAAPGRVAQDRDITRIFQIKKYPGGGKLSGVGKGAGDGVQSPRCDCGRT